MRCILVHTVYYGRTMKQTKEQFLKENEWRIKVFKDCVDLDMRGNEITSCLKMKNSALQRFKNKLKEFDIEVPTPKRGRKPRDYWKKIDMTKYPFPKE